MQLFYKQAHLIQRQQRLVASFHRFERGEGDGSIRRDIAIVCNFETNIVIIALGKLARGNALEVKEFLTGYSS